MHEIIKIIKLLRSEEGCPWDRQQTKEDAGRYLIEEAYEVIEAINEGRPAALREELGDLLFQVLFLIELAEERGEFGLSGVIENLIEKMVRRHPHVFGTAKVEGIDEVRTLWRDIKRNVEGRKYDGLLMGVPRSLPALKRAQFITEQASTLGFDWADTGGVMEKLGEELRELESAMRDGRKEKIEEEIGDLLFCLVNLSRFTHVDAETALTNTLEKFLRRFSYMEKALHDQGKSFAEVSLAHLDLLWDESKKARED